MVFGGTSDAGYGSVGSRDGVVTQARGRTREVGKAAGRLADFLGSHLHFGAIPICSSHLLELWDPAHIACAGSDRVYMQAAKWKLHSREHNRALLDIRSRLSYSALHLRDHLANRRRSNHARTARRRIENRRGRLLRRVIALPAAA